jgi:Domain of unknown function (DUF4105)
MTEPIHPTRRPVDNAPADPTGPSHDDAEAPKPPRRRRPLRRILRWVGVCLLALLIAGMIGWGVLAVYFADTRPGAGGRPVPAAAFLLAGLALTIFIRPRRWGLAGFLALFAGVLAWYLLLLKPSNDRRWLDDVGRTAQAIIDSDRITIRNVRNFDYRTTDDYTPRWEERTYDLNKLRTVDFMLVYWGSKAIAHAIVSFEFEREGRDNDYLAVSIETRKEKGESYSSVQGFFRQYELVYVFADERDVVRLRTNYRNEDVYLYRTKITPEHARGLLLSYARQANSLHEKPQFYNALTSNCLTGVLDLANEQRGASAQGLSWEIIFSGYAARRMYRNGALDTSLPFDELEARSRVNDAAHAADNSPHFSTIIRAGLPGYSRPAKGAGTTP